MFPVGGGCHVSGRLWETKDIHGGNEYGGIFGELDYGSVFFCGSEVFRKYRCSIVVVLSRMVRARLRV